MKNYCIQLEEHLQSKHGVQSKVIFEMSHRHIWINGVEQENPLRHHINSSFKGFMFSIQNKCILVTLFYSKDILRRV